MNKLEQAARQLLEIAVGIQYGTDWNNGTHAKIYRPKFPAAITALREALAEQAEQRPQNCGTGYCSCIECPYEAEQAEQEPVGYWQGTFNTEGGAILYEVPQVSAFGYRYPNHPVYAYPVRTKDLTPHEITDLIREGAADGGWQGFAQRVIAADREKNK